jgi:hypothetical protein
MKRPRVKRASAQRRVGILVRVLENERDRLRHRAIDQRTTLQAIVRRALKLPPLSTTEQAAPGP